MLTVLYRYHYYIEKALGNLLGLSQFLYFVAKETGLGVGPLVCHSTYAVLDTQGGWGIGDVKQLVADCHRRKQRPASNGNCWDVRFITAAKTAPRSKCAHRHDEASPTCDRE